MSSLSGLRRPSINRVVSPFGHFGESRPPARDTCARLKVVRLPRECGTFFVFNREKQ